VPEDPEQVLPQQRVGAGGGVEELGPVQALDEQQDQGQGDHRHGEHEQHLDHQDHPREHRHAHEGHARRPHVEHGHGQVDGAGQGADAADQQAEAEEVDAVGRREHHAGVRGVGEPAAVGRTTEEPARVQEDAAEEERPVAEGVHPGEGDVTGADLQRQQVVGERRGHGHHHEEDHGDGVHGEDLVVGLGAEHVVVGHRQLGPDEQGLDAAHQEEEEGGVAVHQADLLVIDRGDPAPPPLGAGRPAEDAERLVVGDGLVAGGQREWTFLGKGHQLPT